MPVFSKKEDADGQKEQSYDKGYRRIHGCFPVDSSQSTVSMILSEKKNVSFGEETVQKVKKAAKSLGYQKPAKKKQAPDRSLSQTIMILCPTISNGYYNAVVHSIIEKAQEYGYTTLTAVTFRSAEREEAYFRLFAENELAGVISLYPLTKYTWTARDRAG